MTHVTGGAGNIAPVTMPASGPVLERIAAYSWPCGDAQVRRVREGYILASARTDMPVARLRPMPSGACFEVLWWHREAWGRAGPFGTVLALDDALAFIDSEPAFWIHA